MISEMYEKIKTILEIDANMWYQSIFEESWKEKLINFCDDYFENG